jgi:Capsule assembly protein Wzi
MVAGAETVVRVSFLVLAVLAATAEARGVSPYLPVDISPEIERKVERVLILADQPFLRRPIPAATVQDALPRACEQDAALCEDVRRYLASLTKTAGISYASLTASGSSGADTALPNSHGMASLSNYEAAIAAYWQPAGFILVTGGVVAYEGEATPTGTMASIGADFAQIDIGYRDHWWSPALDNAMLLSTQAATMPSVTISNYRPLTKVKLRYEAFVARMSESSNIASGTGTTAGHPQLAGLHLSIEPFPGWSLGVGRIMQYGGGDREDSFGDLLDAFFNPAERDNTGSSEDFGNQVASFTSQFVIGEPLPLAIYFEYAGEDTSTSSNLRLGNTALSAGIAFPKLGDRFAATFEITEWQNAWYVHHIYGDGLRHEGHVLGHWGGDWRLLGDGVGARSAFARVNIDRAFSGEIEASYRQLDNEDYTGGNYETARQLDARYSRRWNQLFVGGEVTLGQDVFGESYSRVGAFIRF